MTNLMTMNVSKLLENNSILGLYIESSNTIQLFSTQRTSLFLVDSLINDLKHGVHRNRDMQEAFNSGTLKWVYFESIEHSIIFKLNYILLKLREKELADLLKKDGYNVVELANKVSLTPGVIKFKKGKYNGYPWQVYLKSGRRINYYVQKKFKHKEDAEAYIANTSLYQMAKDTQCCEIPYREHFKP